MIDIFIDSLYQKSESAVNFLQIKSQIFFNSCKILKKLIEEKFKNRTIPLDQHFPNFTKETNKMFQSIGQNIIFDASLFKSVFIFPELLETIDSVETIQTILDYRSLFILIC